MDAAADGDGIRIAQGVYTGVFGRPRADVEATGLVTQVVYVHKSLSITGGYTTTAWDAPDPTLYPTILDAQGGGRVVYVREGLRVVWSVPLENSASLQERMQLADNPTTHLRSDISPFSSTHGWDSGLLAPGSSFARSFATPGEYTYQDGLGHTGTVTVRGERRIFLPFLSKE